MNDYETMLYCDALAKNAQKALDELTEHINENELDYLVHDAELYARDVASMAQDETANYYSGYEVNEKYTEQMTAEFVKYLKNAAFPFVTCAKSITESIDFFTQRDEKRLASLYVSGLRDLFKLSPIVNALMVLDEKAGQEEAETLEALENTLEKIRLHAPFSGIPTPEMWEQSHKNKSIPLYFWGNFLKRAKGTEREKTGEKLHFAYNMHTCALLHVSGFIYDGSVYGIYTVNPIITTAKPSSRGYGMALRFVPSKADKAYMIEKGACFIVCTESAFEAERKPDENKGETFERLIKKHLDIDNTEKDKTAFFEGVDVPNYAISVKFEGSTLVHEKHLETL